MYNEALFIENDIRSLISKDFPESTIEIFYEPNDDEYFVSIADESIYYSEEYQRLVMEINTDYLWKKNINNFFFIYSPNEISNQLETSMFIDEPIINEYSNWVISDEVTFNSVDISADDMHGMAA